MTLTPTDRLILSSVRIHPTASDLERMNQLIPQVTNWESLAKTAIDRGMGPLLYKKIHLLSNKVLIPENILQNLKSSYFQTLNRNIILSDAFNKLGKTLISNGIQLVALKGIYLSEWLYKDIGLRQLSDIDILVKKEDGVKCIEILENMGYVSSGNEFSEHLLPEKDFIHYPPMVMNGVSVEVHIRLHKENPGYNINIEEFIKNATPAIINKVQVAVPEFYDQLIFLCVHSEKHFVGSKIQFTCFIDIANLIFEFTQTINWPILTNRCTEYECEKVVFKHLLLVNHFFDAPIPEEILRKHGSSLTHEDKEIFTRYLNGYFNVKDHIGSFGNNVRQIKGVGNKVNFIFNNLFPTKKYMVERYKIKNPTVFWLYYPYRYWLVFNSMIGKITKRSFWIKG